MIRPADLWPTATAPFVTCPTFLRIVIPAGKIGYVLVDSLAPIGNDQRWRHTIDTNFEFKRRDAGCPSVPIEYPAPGSQFVQEGAQCLQHALPLP